MRAVGTDARPLRVAVIGAGPAGLYAAEALLKQPDLVLTIDVINRFPTPFGLVRDGVAPDHATMKSVERVFDRVLADPRVRYLGNVTFGEHLRHEDLRRLYDQVVYAVGAQADRRMGIPGEELANSLSALSFVGWYNGHPDYRDVDVDLGVERAVVVGNGNVAMDVTRILARDPASLARTDIADHALEALRASRVREVVVLGRRGPAQASFTPPELRELGRLEGVDVRVDPADLALDPASQAMADSDRHVRANLEHLRRYAEQAGSGAPRRIVLRFLTSPVELVGRDGRVTAVRVERNELVADAKGRLRAKGTGEFETIEAGLVLRSIGYRSVPLPGVPFDTERSTIANVDGRVVDPDTGAPLPGEYVVGWAKRGPSGLIGSNKGDAAATVEAMMADLPTLADAPRPDPAEVDRLLRERGADPVTYADWRILNDYELARGAEQGRPRVKVTDVAEMLAIIRRGRGEA